MTGFQDMILNGILAIGIVYTVVVVVVAVVITVQYMKWRRK
jgi:hypothetical protein